MKKLIVTVVVIFSVLTIFVACNSGSIQHEEKSSVTQQEVNDSTQFVEVYQCPMQCEGDKTYDQSGKCPVCEMDLVKVKKKVVPVPSDTTSK